MSLFPIHVRSLGGDAWSTVWVEACPMPDDYLDGRPVYFGDIDYAGVDSGFESACYADTDEELDGDELYRLTENNADYICTQVMEKYGYCPD
jgi:hypothetical protein